MSHHEDHLNDVLMEEMERLNLGPTGEYPEGMLTPQDQGELRMGVSAYKGKVILAFGKEIAHLGLTSEGAKDLGHLLIEQANGLSKPDFPDKPILCLDFDGVLHSYTSGWKGADVIPDSPVKGALAFVTSALDVFCVSVFSSRTNQRGGIEAMRKWMRKHGFPVYDIDFPREKPPAFITLDDRAAQFNGTWPDIQGLLAFRPWNKKDA